jgi:hypothetical protein
VAVGIVWDTGSMEVPEQKDSDVPFVLDAWMSVCACRLWRDTDRRQKFIVWLWQWFSMALSRHCIASYLATCLCANMLTIQMFCLSSNAYRVELQAGRPSRKPRGPASLQLSECSIGLANSGKTLNVSVSLTRRSVLRET